MVYTKSRYSKQKIGVILDNLGYSQLSYCFIQNANNLLRRDYFWDICAFVQNTGKCCVDPLFAQLSIADAHGYNGKLIATNLHTAYSLIKMPNAAEKYFYIWDVEFLRNNKNFLHNSEIYRNDKLKIICRSKDHERLLHNYCNRKADMINENFNLREIIDGD